MRSSQTPFAHLATASAEGPRESPVWFFWEDDAIPVIGEGGDSLPKRIERDPRCAVGVVEFDSSEAVVKHVGVRGEGSVEPLDPDRAERLLMRYIGYDREAWDPIFRAVLAEPEEFLLVRVEPETIVTRDQSYTPSLG
jgi:hypothetical protein